MDRSQFGMFGNFNKYKCTHLGRRFCSNPYENEGKNPVSILYSAVSTGPLQISNPAGASPTLPCQKLITSIIRLRKRFQLLNQSIPTTISNHSLKTSPKMLRMHCYTTHNEEDN